MKRSTSFYFVRAWFLLNVFISLYPPLYWAASKHTELIFGFPASFIYFIVVSVSITFSILFACWQDSSAGELTS
jgi:hypothetical protein